MQACIGLCFLCICKAAICKSKCARRAARLKKRMSNRHCKPTMIKRLCCAYCDNPVLTNELCYLGISCKGFAADFFCMILRLIHMPANASSPVAAKISTAPCQLPFIIAPPARVLVCTDGMRAAVAMAKKCSGFILVKPTK